MNLSENEIISNRTIDFQKIFSEYGDQTRVWIHPFFRDLKDDQEIDWVRLRFDEMTAQWTYHQKPVPGAYCLHRNRFAIIANPHEVSGCGIDSSFKCLAEINRYLGGSTGSQVHYLNGETVLSLPRYQVRSAINSGQIGPKTTIINLEVTSLQELREGKLELPAQESFLSNMFKDLAVASSPTT